MSTYSHDPHKFADTGLQLRTPVDLVPANQYSQLTNAAPLIEGELRTREGLLLIQKVFDVACIATLGRPTTGSSNATIVNTIYAHGFLAGSTVQIIVTSSDPSSSSAASPGTYSVLITSVPTPTSFSFTPSIPTSWAATDLIVGVFAQATDQSLGTTLTQTIITNIFRLNQALPTLSTTQIVAMSGRLYRANLAGGNQLISVDTQITNIQITSNVLIVTLSTVVPYTAGTVVTFSGLTTATFLNGVSVVSAPYTPGLDTQFFGIFTHADYPSTADNGTATGNVLTPPAFIELVTPSLADEPPTAQNGFSGRPLSIISFRFTNDPASWAIIADQNRMVKYRENNTGGIGYYFWALGNPTPLTQASASAGGAGNLNSTGGPGYDWRYTYHDGVVNTEGNPSPITVGASGGTVRPTTWTTPSQAGTLAVGNPGNAVDGSTTTATVIAGFAEDFGSGPHVPPPVHQTQSVTYANAASGGGTVVLNVTYSCTYDSTGSTVGQARVVCQYSTDGISFTGFLTLSNANVGKTTISTNLPAGTDSSTVQVKFVSYASAGGSSSVEILMSVYDINLTTAASTTTVTLALTNQQALVCCQLPGTLNDGRVQNIRLYRRGGSLPDGWRLVGTFPIASAVQGGCGLGFVELVDNIGDPELESQPLLELDNDAPVTSISTSNQALSFIWGPIGLEARVMGCGDPNRPECVYYSKPGNPDAWPPQNFIEVSDPGTPIIAGCAYNNHSYAYSREGIFDLVEGLGTGSIFTSFPTPSTHGLYTPWGLALGPSMYFIAKDGIYETTGGQEASLVENDIKPIFPTYDSPGRDVGPYEAVDYSLPDQMRLVYHNNEVWFCYIGATTGQRQVLVYDIYKKRWRACSYSVGISEVYSQPATTSSLLLGSSGGSYYESGGQTDPFEMGIIENVAVGSTNITGVTLPGGTYYVMVSRINSFGENFITHEYSGILVDSSHGIAVLFPPGAPATWRVYLGTAPGAENQYIDFPTASLPANRQVIITAPGTSGVPPSINQLFRIPVTVVTGAHDQGVPLNRKQLGNVIFDVDADSSSIRIVPSINGATQDKPAIAVTGAGRQQAALDLSDFFAFNTEYQVTWQLTALPDGTYSDPVLYQYDTLHFLEPAGLYHWQTQPTSFGFPGYVHCRDCYIAIRSTADALLTMQVDGTVNQVYTIPSTGGLRQKVYIPFSSNKGLVYQFAVDCPQEFRLYEEDLEIRVKPWLGLLGYSVQRVLGGETEA